MSRRMCAVALVLGGGLMLASLAWAAVTADQIAKRITNKINGRWKTQQLKVSVVPLSDADTAKGRFKRIDVSARSVTVSDVKLSPVVINATDVTLDLNKLVRENQVVCVRRKCGVFTAKVSEADLNRALAHKKTPIDNLRVALGNGVLVFTGTYRLGFGANLRLEGVLECKDHYAVSFVPKKASVSGVPLPAGPLKTVLKKMNPLLDFRKVPLTPRVDKLTVKSGVLTING